MTWLEMNLQLLVNVNHCYSALKRALASSMSYFMIKIGYGTSLMAAEIGKA
jgi:hypothetical protein